VQGFAQYAIVAMPNTRHPELRHTIQDCCRGFRHVLLMPDMPGVCSLGVLAREIGGELGFELPQRLFHQSAAFAKRTIDLSISLFVLALLLPLFLLIMLAVRVTSPGPIFYGHSRYGRDGDLFKALKFRTMAMNSDAILEEHLRRHPELREEWNRDHKLKNDPRITSIGTWLRRYSLDELPQLWNVIKGDMSLVGPRPIVAAEIPKYGLGYNLYTRVRPGITGLWQVSGRNNTTYEERVAFDEYYVRNWSIWLDSYILARTAKVVLTADGAY
jgi:Undecaprenyl-phosphate galactose phosphotransferase WbaP